MLAVHCTNIGDCLYVSVVDNNYVTIVSQNKKAPMGGAPNHGFKLGYGPTCLLSILSTIKRSKWCIMG